MQLLPHKIAGIVLKFDAIFNNFVNKFLFKYTTFVSVKFDMKMVFGTEIDMKF